MFNNNRDKMSMTPAKVIESQDFEVSDELTDFFMDRASDILRNQEDEIEYVVFTYDYLKKLKKEIKSGDFDTELNKKLKEEAIETIDKLMEICNAEHMDGLYLSIY